MNKVGSIQVCENLTYRLELVEHWKWRFRMYFLTWAERIPDDQSAVQENNVSFISFSVDKDKEVSILWMFVPPETRGTPTSDIILSQFFQLIEKSWLTLGTTTQIKKPLLAAKLAKIGFIPERWDIIARIISIWEDNIPNIIIDKNQRRGTKDDVHPKSMSSTWKNTFYNVSDSDMKWGKRVALQTKYFPPSDPTIRAYVQMWSEEIEGKTRFYPARVKKILEK